MVRRPPAPARPFSTSSRSATRSKSNPKARSSSARKPPKTTPRDWLTEAHRWRVSLVLLRPATVALPAPGEHVSVEGLETLDPAAARLAARAAHAVAVPELHDRVAGARDKVQQTADDIDALEADLAQARQAAPTPDAPTWRNRRAEDDVPLWALVNFADHLSGRGADRLEGALLASGLLDALVPPDGRLTAGDTVIPARTPAPGRTLAGVLQPEHTTRTWA